MELPRNMGNILITGATFYDILGITMSEGTARQRKAEFSFRSLP